MRVIVNNAMHIELYSKLVLWFVSSDLMRSIFTGVAGRPFKIITIRLVPKIIAFV